MGCTSEDETRGTVQIALLDYPGLDEGFGYDVRIEADGEVIDERSLSGFEWHNKGDFLDQTWTTDFEVPAGEVTLVSDMTAHPRPVDDPSIPVGPS